LKIGFDAKRAFHNLTGLGNYSRSVIKSISNIMKNDQFYLFTPAHNIDNFQINNDNIKRVTAPKNYNKKYWRFKGVNKELERLNLDIYHGLSNEIPYGIKIKSIVTIHDLLFLKYPSFYNYIDRKIYYMKSKLACQNANFIIATSQQTKNDIISFFNIPEDKIRVIYQTCDDVFIYHSDNIKMTPNIAKAIQTPYLLYVGSIEERKNLIFLLQAINKMKKEIKLICVGKKTKYYNRIAKYINENKLQERVLFINDCSKKELAILYRKSRGLVYPSIDEGFGIPIIESMYSKVPVITSNQEIFQEIGGKNSYYFKKNNLDSLIQTISEIWTDSLERERRIQANFKYVQKFSAINQAKQIINLYKEC
tara:strand:+ start:2103 stop:3197 length:1095 start_codon:yes stop_codon:yes gene_type:complete